jgi:hypothetical protein
MRQTLQLAHPISNGRNFAPERMDMIRKVLFAALPALAMVGCLNDTSEDMRAKEAATESAGPSRDLATLETPVKITVGSKSATLYKSQEGDEILESIHLKGEAPLLTPEMSGKTWKEIVASIAPGSKLAPEYANEIYLAETGESTPGVMPSPDGQIERPESGAEGLAKTSADAVWFKENFCRTGITFSWCRLNRTAVHALGATVDWDKTKAKRSHTYICVNSGSQVDFKIRIDGKYKVTTTILNDGFVYGYTHNSPKDIFDFYINTWHQYEVHNTDPAANWHWAVYGW